MDEEMDSSSFIEVTAIKQNATAQGISLGTDQTLSDMRVYQKKND